MLQFRAMAPWPTPPSAPEISVGDPVFSLFEGAVRSLPPSPSPGLSFVNAVFALSGAASFVYIHGALFVSFVVAALLGRPGVLG